MGKRSRSARPSKEFHAACFGLAIVLAVWMIAFPARAGDSGFFLGYSPIHHAWAGAGAAAPRDSSWLHINPAGIADLDGRLDLSLAPIYMQTRAHLRGPVSNPFVERLEDQDLFISGEAGVVCPAGDGAWGVSFVSQGGAGVTFPHSRSLPGALFGNGDRRLTFQQGRLGVGYARRFDDGWNLGASVHGSVSRFRTDHLTLNMTPTRGNYDFDWSLGYGFSLGIMKSWERFAVGLEYTSHEWSQPFDKYRDLLRHPLEIPQYAQLGFRYDMGSRWTLVSDLRWIDWSSIALIANPPLKNGFGREDTYSAKLGVEWRVNGRWTLYSGYSRTLEPCIPDNRVFLNILVPTTSQDHVALGCSHRWGDHHEVQCTWVHTLPREQKETGWNNPFSVLGHGSRLSNQYDLLSVGYTYYFTSTSFPRRRESRTL